MSIELACPNCRKRLKAPPGAEGKRFKCPHCQEIVIVPGAASDGSSISISGSSNVAPLYSSGAVSSNASGISGISGQAKGAVPPAERTERWFVKSSAGADFGPITREELDRWASEDRLDSESQILREGAGQWQWASDLYPRLYPTNGATASASKASDSTASDLGEAKAPAQRNERAADVSDTYAATGDYDLTAMSPKPETAAFQQPAVAEPMPLAGAATYAVTPPPEPSVPLPTREPSFDSSQPSSSSKYSIEMLPSDKSKTTAGVLGILFGGLGVHRFYLGDVPIGVAQALVTLATCGIGAWWGVFEGIMILIGQIDRDAQGRKLRD
jgi:LSD1 subclass zinc finger protein